MNNILLSVVLIISLMGCGLALDEDMRPGEAAAKERFEKGFGSPWIGGDSPVFGSSNQGFTDTYTLQDDSSIQEVVDPLPSWNEGSAKNAILSFVANVTDESNPNYVEPEDRIATFDNDGTLWCEYPDVVQFIFLLDRVKDMASEHPEWNDTEPFSSILSGGRYALSDFSRDEVMQIWFATSSNITADEYTSLARDWLDKSINSHFDLPYTACVYKPMLELLNYLRTEGFKIYIVSGGDEDFVRAFSEEVYGIPPEQVIGTALSLQFIENNGSTNLMRLPEFLVWTDGQEKAKEIQNNIGVRPIFAYGNFDGDIPMLQFATGGDRQGIGLLNHHDDPIREYAYVDYALGGGLDKGLEIAGEWGWQVVSMKDDWKCIF
jgi:phosphoserine phosphatase